MKPNLSNKDSLRIIEEMILTARGDLATDGGKYFLLWGYLILISSLIHFTLLITELKNSFDIGLVWGIAMCIGILVSFIWGYKDSKKQLVKTYMSEVNKKIWVGFTLFLFVLIFFSLENSIKYIYPSISLVYLFALYISSTLYQIKWMYISVLIGLICVICYKFVPLTYYPLVMAVLMLSGNIIPGYIIQYRAKKSTDA